MVAAHTTQQQTARKYQDWRKLTYDDVKIIRCRAQAGEPQSVIAADFGITQGYVSQIAHGKARNYQYERSLVDGKIRAFGYGFSGEQLEVVEVEDTPEIRELSKQEQRSALIEARRELEREIREINNKLAALDNIPF